MAASEGSSGSGRGAGVVVVVGGGRSRSRLDRRLRLIQRSRLVRRLGGDFEGDEVGDGAVDVLAGAGADGDEADDAGSVGVEGDDADDLPSGARRGLGEETALADGEVRGRAAGPSASTLLKMDGAEVAEVLAMPAAPELAEDDVTTAVESSEAIGRGGAGGEESVVDGGEEELGADAEELGGREREGIRRISRGHRQRTSVDGSFDLDEKGVQLLVADALTPEEGTEAGFRDPDNALDAAQSPGSSDGRELEAEVPAAGERLEVVVDLAVEVGGDESAEESSGSLEGCGLVEEDGALGHSPSGEEALKGVEDGVGAVVVEKLDVQATADTARKQETPPFDGDAGLGIDGVDGSELIDEDGSEGAGVSIEALSWQLSMSRRRAGLGLGEEAALTESDGLLDVVAGLLGDPVALTKDGEDGGGSGVAMVDVDLEDEEVGETVVGREKDGVFGVFFHRRVREPAAETDESVVQMEIEMVDDLEMLGSAGAESGEDVVEALCLGVADPEEEGVLTLGEGGDGVLVEGAAHEPGLETEEDGGDAEEELEAKGPMEVQVTRGTDLGAEGRAEETDGGDPAPGRGAVEELGVGTRDDPGRPVVVGLGEEVGAVVVVGLAELSVVQGLGDVVGGVLIGADVAVVLGDVSGDDLVDATGLVGSELGTVGDPVEDDLTIDEVGDALEVDVAAKRVEDVRSGAGGDEGCPELEPRDGDEEALLPRRGEAGFGEEEVAADLGADLLPRVDSEPERAGRSVAEDDESSWSFGVLEGEARKTDPVDPEEVTTELGPGVADLLAGGLVPGVVAVEGSSVEESGSKDDGGDVSSGVVGRVYGSTESASGEAFDRRELRLLQRERVGGGVPAETEDTDVADVGDAVLFGEAADAVVVVGGELSEVEAGATEEVAETVDDADGVLLGVDADDGVVDIETSDEVLELVAVEKGVAGVEGVEAELVEDDEKDPGTGAGTHDDPSESPQLEVAVDQGLGDVLREDDAKSVAMGLVDADLIEGRLEVRGDGDGVGAVDEEDGEEGGEEVDARLEQVVETGPRQRRRGGRIHDWSDLGGVGRLLGDGEVGQDVDDGSGRLSRVDSLQDTLLLPFLELSVVLLALGEGEAAVGALGAGEGLSEVGREELGALLEGQVDRDSSIGASGGGGEETLGGSVVLKVGLLGALLDAQDLEVGHLVQEGLEGGVVEEGVVVDDSEVPEGAVDVEVAVAVERAGEDGAEDREVGCERGSEGEGRD